MMAAALQLAAGWFSHLPCLHSTSKQPHVNHKPTPLLERLGCVSMLVSLFFTFPREGKVAENMAGCGMGSPALSLSFTLAPDRRGEKQGREEQLILQVFSKGIQSSGEAGVRRQCL